GGVQPGLGGVGQAVAVGVAADVLRAEVVGGGAGGAGVVREGGDSQRQRGGVGQQIGPGHVGAEQEAARGGRVGGVGGGRVQRILRVDVLLEDDRRRAVAAVERRVAGGCAAGRGLQRLLEGIVFRRAGVVVIAPGIIPRLRGARRAVIQL